MEDRCLWCGRPAERFGPYVEADCMCRRCALENDGIYNKRLRAVNIALVVVGIFLVVEAAALTWWALS